MIRTAYTQHKKIIAYLLGCVLLLAFFAPTLVFGQENLAPQYEPLAELPIPETNGDGLSFVEYLNGIFIFTIGIAIALAVLMIAIGGIRYMSTDAVSGKKEGLGLVNGAVGGLILVLLSWIILRTINPAFLNISLNLSDVPVASDNSSSLVPDNPAMREYFRIIDGIYNDNRSVSDTIDSIEEEITRINTELETAPNEQKEFLTNVRNRLQLEANLLGKFARFVDIWKLTIAVASKSQATAGGSDTMGNGAPKESVESYYRNFNETVYPGLNSRKYEFFTLLEEYRKLPGVQINSTKISTFYTTKLQELKSYIDELYHYRIVCTYDTRTTYSGIGSSGYNPTVTPQSYPCLVNGKNAPTPPEITQPLHSIDDIINIEI